MTDDSERPGQWEHVTFAPVGIPFASIPITISRTYDTLRADRQLDFGYGWKFDLGNPKVQVDLGGGGLSGFADYVPMRDGARVTVTLADGTVHGFTFEAQQHRDRFGVPDGSHVPFFAPDAGQTSYLGVKEVRLVKVGDEYFDLATNLSFNPARIEFGGAYTLFTRGGLRVGIDARDTTRSWISDRNGNSLLFTTDSIETLHGRANDFGMIRKGLDGYTGLEIFVVKDRSGKDFHFRDLGLGEPTGRRVTVERDYAGRIVAVVDSEGNRIKYQYDAHGDLAAVTDRTGATTTHSYAQPSTLNPQLPAHYLTSITDALGRPAARVEYTPQARVLRLIDAADKRTDYSYNLGQRSETVTDAAGGVTTAAADARGNVIRTVDSSGQTTVFTYDASDRAERLRPA